MTKKQASTLIAVTRELRRIFFARTKLPRLRVAQIGRSSELRGFEGLEGISS